MVSFVQPSFTRGEVSPALYGRVDLTAYRTALKRARNVTVLSTGGIENRPGTEFRAPVKDHSKPPRLFRYKFGVLNQYVLEVGDQYMRFMLNGNHILNTATTAISAATNANPVVVTSTAHGLSNGDELEISGVVGMTELNGRRFLAANVTANTFELQDQMGGANVDGTGYGTYTSGGTVSTVYELTTPYTQSELLALQAVQNPTQMTFTHPNHPPMDLERVTDTNWTLTEVNFDPNVIAPSNISATAITTGTTTDRYTVTGLSGDFLEESLIGRAAAVGTAITGATQANPVVITTSTAHGLVDGDGIFIDDVVGMTEINGKYYRINQLTTTTFELLDNIDGFTGVDGTGFTAYSSGGSVFPTFTEVTNAAATRDTDISWTSQAGIVLYRVYREKNGVYGFIGQTNSNVFTDDNITPDFNITPPVQRNFFANSGNYPATSAYYQQRQAYAGSDNNPDTTYYSQIAARTNFSFRTPTTEDDAIVATMASQDVNSIKHMVPLDKLIIFTTGAEWAISGSPELGFTPTTIDQEVQSNWGTGDIPPISVAGSVVFTDPSATVVRSLVFDFGTNGFRTEELTLLSRHLLNGKQLVDWSFVKAPQFRLYGVRDDGEVLALTYDVSQEVVGWSTWDTDGKIERITQLFNDVSPTEDTLYMVVQRNINGNVVRFIERSLGRQFTDVRDCRFSDASVSVNSPVAITGVTAANPVVVTAPSHGFTNGDTVDIFDCVWESDFDADFNETQPTQINTRRFTVANATTDTFELSGEDGSANNAYVEGGTARKTVTEVTGLFHLEGENVVVLADGNVISNLTVSGGKISFTPGSAHSRVHVGLRYISDAETLDPEPNPRQTIQGHHVKISSVTVRLEKSRGLLVGPDSSLLTEMKQREFEAMGDPTVLLTGDIEIQLAPTWNTHGRLLFRQKDPLPMTILAIVPDAEVGKISDNG